MKELLFVDCMIRGEASRTRRIAEAFLAELGEETYHVTHLDLSAAGLMPHDRARLEKRDALLAAGELDDEMFRYAHQFAAADAVVIAAPFWDLSFPALLKIYIENISVGGITFGYADAGPEGLCRGTHLIFFTSRGGIYTGSGMEHGNAYMQSLKTFFGFDNYTCVAADGLDIVGYDIETALAAACEEARKAARLLKEA